MVLILVILALWILAGLAAAALCVATRRTDDEIALDERLGRTGRTFSRDIAV
jgi:hypothetical protein